MSFRSSNFDSPRNLRHNFQNVSLEELLLIVYYIYIYIYNIDISSPIANTPSTTTGGVPYNARKWPFRRYLRSAPANEHSIPLAISRVVPYAF